MRRLVTLHRSRARYGAAVAMVLAVSLNGCGKQEELPAKPAEGPVPQVVKEEIVKLGFAAPLTGPQAHYGEEMRNGVLLALDEANTAKIMIGGAQVKFELLSEDDQADPAKGTVVAQKLVDAGIKGMLGHFNSGTSIPASKIYADAGIPQVAMATAPAYTASGYKTTFRMMTNDTQQGAVMGRYAVQKLGIKRLVIIDDRTAYGQGLADEFEKAAKAAGGEVVKREYTTDKSVDFAAILTNVKRAKAEAVFYGGADAQAGPMARQMKQLGVSSKLLGGEMMRSPNFLKLAGESANGAIASLAGLPLDQMPGGKDYAIKYKAKFNAEVETYSPFAYDGTMTLIEAMKRADSVDPVKYLPEVAKTQRAGVTSSSLSYDEKGDLRDAAITVYKVEGNDWKVMEALEK